MIDKFCSCCSRKMKRDTFRVPYICRNCSKERPRYLKLEAVKQKGGKCIACGYNKVPASLDFHHLNPNTKQFTISVGLVAFCDKVQEELDKCVLLCRNCHAELHWMEHNDKLGYL